MDRSLGLAFDVRCESTERLLLLSKLDSTVSTRIGLGAGFAVGRAAGLESSTGGSLLAAWTGIGLSTDATGLVNETSFDCVIASLLVTLGS